MAFLTIASAQQANGTDGTSAPPLAVFAAYSPDQGRQALSIDGTATLEEVRSDPAAFETRIGHGTPIPYLRRAPCLSHFRPKPAHRARRRRPLRGRAGGGYSGGAAAAGRSPANPEAWRMMRRLTGVSRWVAARPALRIARTGAPPAR